MMRIYVIKKHISIRNEYFRILGGIFCAFVFNLWISICLKSWTSIWKYTALSSPLNTAVLVLCAMLVIAIAVRVYPIYVTKLQLDNFADELIREMEIAGNVGAETSARERTLQEKTGLTPTVSWSKTGNIQLNEEVTVTLTLDRNIGFFGGFGSFPVRLTARASGKSVNPDCNRNH